MASSTPSPFSSRSRLLMASMSVTSTLSVISRVSRRGDSRAVSSTLTTSPISRGSSSWRPDRLTGIDSGGASGNWSCQRRAWRQAWSSTQSPIGPISPCSSARGMNAGGGRRPLVAGGVPEVVVDVLEVIQVDEQHGQVALAVAGQGVLDPLGEQGPVGQAGQAAVEGLVDELGLRLLAVGDVAGVQRQPARVGVL